MDYFTIILIIIFITTLLNVISLNKGPYFTLTRSFYNGDGNGNIAVDENNFYLISKSHINKYNKNTTKLVKTFQNEELALIDGLVIGKYLYCLNKIKHSIEIFDNELEHVMTVLLNFEGTLKWINYYNKKWYGYLTYEQNMSKNKIIKFTINFDKNIIKILQKIAVPKKLLNNFNCRIKNGFFFYINKKKIIYIMKEINGGLKRITTIPINANQSICWDNNLLWCIDSEYNQISINKLNNF